MFDRCFAIEANAQRDAVSRAGCCVERDREIVLNVNVRGVERMVSRDFGYEVVRRTRAEVVDDKRIAVRMILAGRSDCLLVDSGLIGEVRPIPRASDTRGFVSTM